MNKTHIAIMFGTLLLLSVAAFFVGKSIGKSKQ
jgi:hypothetical protein